MKNNQVHKFVTVGGDGHLRDVGGSSSRILHVNHRLAVLRRQADRAGRHVLRTVHGGCNLQLPAAVWLLLDHSDRHVLVVRRHLSRGVTATATGRS